MAKILLLTTGLNGILNASYAVAKRLEAAGHDVVISTPRDRRELVEREGFQYKSLPMIELNPAPEIPNEIARKKRWRRWQYLIQSRKERREKALTATRPIAFQALLNQEEPDLVIADVELHEYIFATYAMGIPLLLLSQWYSLWNRPGLPYLLSDTIPGVGFRGSRIGMWLDWQKIKIKRWWRFKKQATLSLRASRPSALKALVDELGFPKKYIRSNYWPGPFTYSELPVLAMAPLEMEFPHQTRPNLHYVGPMVYLDRYESQGKDHLGRSVADLNEIARRNQQKVIVATGTTMRPGDENFIRKLISVFTQEQSWLLLLGPINEQTLHTLGDIPQNVALFTFLPQLSALAIADLSINHGGIHTIHECLYFELPMLVYSGKKSDQNGCAARVHYHGLGIMADRHKGGPREMAEKIEELLNEGTYRLKASAFSLAIKDYEKNGTLEKKITTALEGGIPLVSREY